MKIQYFVDDPYSNDEPIGYNTIEEANSAAEDLENRRADWNHGNGAKWPVRVVPRDVED